MTDFDRIIWRKAITFVHFFTRWCPACQELRPMIGQFQKEMHGRIDLYQIDMEDPAMCEIINRYNIKEVPSLFFFYRGEIMWQKSSPATYEELLSTLNRIEERIEREGD